MIPKIIHYCWFGRNPKPFLVKKCIRSWKKYCKEYKIIEWNENNFIIKNAPAYVRQAYKAQKWAFVTDYVRLFVLYKYAGIYLDSDVEVIKPLDGFLKHKGFSGFEQEFSVPTGIMASEKKHPLILEWISEYKEKNFILSDGSYNLETNVEAITNSMILHGLRLDNSFQIISDYAFYPKDYFCPKSYNDGYIYLTKNTHVIHHFAGSWKTSKERKDYKRTIFRKRIEKWSRPIKEKTKYLIGEKNYHKFKLVIKKIIN